MATDVNAGTVTVKPHGQDGRSPRVEAHRLTLKHGLPEIGGYYGCDLETGEFVSA